MHDAQPRTLPARCLFLWPTPAMTYLVAERQHIHIFLTGVQKLAIQELSVAASGVFIFSLEDPADVEQIHSAIAATTPPACATRDLSAVPEGRLVAPRRGQLRVNVASNFSTRDGRRDPSPNSSHVGGRVIQIPARTRCGERIGYTARSASPRRRPRTLVATAPQTVYTGDSQQKHTATASFWIRPIGGRTELVRGSSLEPERRIGDVRAPIPTGQLPGLTATR